MWTTSILTSNVRGFINILANKYNISFFGYPLNVQEIEDKLFVTFYGWANLSLQQSSSIYKELKAGDFVRHVEWHGNSFIISLEQPKETAYLYSENIIYLRPILVLPDFTQTYTVASWNREDINKILQLKIPNVSIKLKYIKEKPIENIGLFAPSKLTQKQKDAFYLAKKQGYYMFPKRNIHLNELAKQSDISLATFQAHLRKAEQKILNSYLELE